jgi:hypothetical protein
MCYYYYVSKVILGGIMNLFTDPTPAPFTHLICRLPQPAQQADKLIWDNPPLMFFGEIVEALTLVAGTLWIKTSKSKVRLPVSTTALKLI